MRDKRQEQFRPASPTVYDSGGEWPSVHDETLADFGRGDAPDPERIGRFHIHGRLGEGGMGVVYSGYDDDLGRSVAIKLMHAALDADLETRPRLLREAQALARLSHPNVVQIFEVGRHEGRLFVAMEYVHGKTLQAWLRGPDGPRTWRQILDVFLAAGRGLAAAHHVGLVHRDFKPSNVMIGADGRVRVLDFGLVGSLLDCSIDPSAPRPPPVREGPTLPVLQTPLTMTGDVLGTPAYMAPEQYNGRRCDARADQFSFCVALYEALYHRRPFAGATAWEALEASERGEIQPPPLHSRVPAWLHAAVVRGLSPDPAARWPSMTELLAELERDRQGPVRTRFAVGAAAVTAAVGLWFSAVEAPTTAEECEAELNEALGSAWDERTAAALGPAARVRVEGLIKTWRTIRSELCATRHMGSFSAAEYRRGIECLEPYRRLFVRLGERLADGAGDVNPAELPDPARIAACADPSDMSHQTFHGSAGDQEAARRIEEGITEAEVAFITGRYRDSEALAHSAVRAAEELGHAPTLAHALYHLGRAQDFGLRAAAAPRTLAAADLLAVEHDLHDLAANIALRRLRFAAYHREPAEVGRVWYEVLRGRLARVGVADDPRRLEAHNYLGEIALVRHDWAIAEREFRSVLDHAAGTATLLRGPALLGLGRVAFGRGDVAEAHARLAEAQALIEAEWGQEHPRLVPVLLNSADVLLSQGRLVDAETAAQRALAIAKANPRSPRIAVAYYYAALVARERGEFARALALAEHARAELRARELTPEQRSYRPVVLDLVGEMAFKTGEASAALAPYLELLGSSSADDPGQGPALAEAYTRAAGLADRAGADDLVLRFAAAARPFLAAPELASAPELAVDLALAEAHALLRRGRVAAATLVIRSALETWDLDDTATDPRAAALHHALFLALQTKAPAEARCHALRARDLWTLQRPPSRAEFDSLTAWLRAHPDRGDRS
ncbi:serine/threonine-protein kinase [Nannocystis sp. SCPEA4]|uniref:serine/threonine-protein kinase n=1 Tax=Nannocystis sp. SCPEA4 TaxID=2996787 RepID=UPI00226F1BF5|nr:serine/threonine-protein kinase [Nannocystis sp. SCPEA4]MCY1054761.1 protein kinase [Nannocystis sp. SCPEA4]